MTKTKRFINIMEYDYRIHTDPELVTTPSLTIPEQNFTLRQILDRFTTGQSINGMGTYNDYDYQPGQEISFNDFQPHPNTLDLVERKAMARKAMEQINKIHQDVKDKTKTVQTTPESTH